MRSLLIVVALVLAYVLPTVPVASVESEVEPQRSFKAEVFEEIVARNIDAPTKVAAKPVPKPEPKPVTPTRPTYTGNKQAWLTASNIPRSDWQYADHIIQKESGWRYDVWNGSGSSAYGLCQTMTSIHKPPQSFYSDPVEQLNWCHNYATGRYSGWSNAYDAWISKNWW